MSRVRDENGRFVPGVSGNAGGRPKGLRLLAKQVTGDGSKLADFWAAVMNDKAAKAGDRIAASRLLAEYAFGRPVQVTEGELSIHAGPRLDYGRLTVDELEALERLEAKALPDPKETA